MQWACVNTADSVPESTYAISELNDATRHARSCNSCTRALQEVKAPSSILFGELTVHLLAPFCDLRGILSS
jgi:hypothetical protein